jgi:type VI secretion system secreted protein VgrG
MAVGRRTRFLFESRGVEPDTFLVARFEGEEAISRPYRFTVDLVSDEPVVDLEAVLAHPAVLRIEEEGEEVRRFEGVIAAVEQLDRGPQYIHYRVELVPRLWWLTLSMQNQIYQDRSLPQILDQELREGGVPTDAFQIRLAKAEHPAREYVVQFQETDFDFISRWMEHEGAFYYFEDGDGGERIAIVDSNDSLPRIPGDDRIEYRTDTGLEEAADDAVRELCCRRSTTTAKVLLRDYNYRLPKVDLHAEVPVDRGTRGVRCEYGAHFRTHDEGRALARVRAQELACRGEVLEGRSSCARFRPGHVFALSGHYREGMNRDLLLTRVRHEGEQGVPGSAAAGTAGELQQVEYHNRFEAIPADVPFRPQRVTPRPRLYGVMNARVEGETSTPYAEIDDWGRYKVRMPFDVSDAREGHASRYIRMAQPYSGESEGMHFPLRKNTEVLFTCVDGDPDRPIIVGAVPNPDTPSPVTNENRSKNVIRTASGCTIEINDLLG